MYTLCLSYPISYHSSNPLLLLLAPVKTQAARFFLTGANVEPDDADHSLLAPVKTQCRQRTADYFEPVKVLGKG